MDEFWLRLAQLLDSRKAGRLTRSRGAAAGNALLLTGFREYCVDMDDNFGSVRPVIGALGEILVSLLMMSEGENAVVKSDNIRSRTLF